MTNFLFYSILFISGYFVVISVADAMKSAMKERRRRAIVEECKEMLRDSWEKNNSNYKEEN